MSVSGVINTHFIVAYMIAQHGTDEQKQRLLPKMASGEVRGAFSMSEPELGSDVAAIKSAVSNLESAAHAMSEALYKAASNAGGAAPGAAETAAGDGAAADDDAIDAEFEVKS